MRRIGLVLVLVLALGAMPARGAVDDGYAAAEQAGPATSVLAAFYARAAPVAHARHPAPESGPRRVGIQAGHWLTDEVPDELARLRPLGGAVYGDVTESAYVLDVARRVSTLLRARGYVVDLLPATVPERYRADVFVSLHADGDETGTARGFKVAHGFERGLHEDLLVDILAEEYGKATHLPIDTNVTEEMTRYYAFRYWRFKHSVAELTPAAIIELGFITSAADRALLTRQRDVVAGSIANAVTRFLSEVPARGPTRNAEQLALRGIEP